METLISLGAISARWRTEKLHMALSMSGMKEIGAISFRRTPGIVILGAISPD